MTNIADVAVLGGGSAGSFTAAMLGRAGVSTVLFDIHQTYPQDFRCEKIHNDQFQLLQKTGLASDVLPVATPIQEMWVSRGGRMIGKMRLRDGTPYEYGIAYEDLVNRVRRLIPESVRFVNAKVTNVRTSADRQQITLANGETWETRLVVAATGLNNIMRDRVHRTEISRCHSISIGFDLAGSFRFPAITHFPKWPSRIAYVSMFPIGKRMRVNWFVYREQRDPWLASVRADPLRQMLSDMPELWRFFNGMPQIVSDVHVRPVNLYKIDGHRSVDGLVLIGDNYATSCPAAGTGLNKVLTDIERLCHHYIPAWLASPMMGAEKIRQFYADPEKIASEEHSAGLAFHMRSVATETTFLWRARRRFWMTMQHIEALRSWWWQRQGPDASLPLVTRET